MPFFDWAAENGNIVVKGRLWVYFAITIPLTMLILILAWAWLIFRGRRRSELRMVERERRDVLGKVKLV